MKKVVFRIIVGIGAEWRQEKKNDWYVQEQGRKSFYI